ncbi:MAG: TPR REGION protein [Gammaproteobacteria bacterium]|nr:TPR REGION protein [Gammaproteobacteria bacterium]
MNRKILILALVAVYVSTSHIIAWAQTGSHIKDGGGKMPETVVWFDEPREITDIRLLLQEGKNQLAVDKARDYVANLRNVPGVDAEKRRYFGLSALCSALTSSGELAEAIKACSDAIEIYPTRWQALNNRGVAHYVSGQLDQSLQDYRQALSLVRDLVPVTELLQHNIALAEAKK